LAVWQLFSPNTFGGYARPARAYLKPSIHSVSACELRPSAASIAALYPRNAWSLDMTPRVSGCSARSALAAFLFGATIGLGLLALIVAA
jgi:hypothetical protein